MSRAEVESSTRKDLLDRCPFAADAAFFVSLRPLSLSWQQGLFDRAQVTLRRDGQGDDVQAETVTFTACAHGQEQIDYAGGRTPAPTRWRRT
jgi:hypothetical protein